MLRSFDDLTSYRARLGEDRFDVTDLLFNASDGALKYLVIDTGAWFESQYALVAQALIGEVDSETAEIRLEASPEQFSDAPRWEGEEQTLMPILSSLPPLVVGPFGATYAPLAIAAEMQDPGGDVADEGRAQDPRVASALDKFETARSWIGAAVFGRDGELGVLDDLLIDPETDRVTHLVIAHQGVGKGKVQVVPYQLLRYRASGGHLVLDTTSAKLADAPQIDEVSRLERHWHKDVHGYFFMPV